jgi:hypothetical protein
VTEHINRTDGKGISRAELLKRGTLAGAGALALGPMAAQAASTAQFEPDATSARQLFRIYLSETTDFTNCVFSALLIPQANFPAAVKRARTFRAGLQTKYGIRTNHDIRAAGLIGNHSHFSNLQLTDAQIAQIYLKGLHFTAKTAGAKLLLAEFPSKQRRLALTQLLVRTNARLHKWNGYGVLISHAVTATAIHPLMRSLVLYRGIPAQLDPWFEPGKPQLDRIVSHPKLRAGRHIQFVEFSNFASFARLRFTNPSQRVMTLQVQNAISILKPILVEVVRPRG